MKRDLKKLEDLLEKFKALKKGFQEADVKIVDGKIFIGNPGENPTQTETCQPHLKTEQ
jgi:hypothetical protein